MRSILALVFGAMLLVQGCSGETRSDISETGNDMKRDIKQAARNVGDTVQDATD